ncbi:MAG TPA: YggS family pyridoxal phosphate-dependent enzyme [Cellulomonas sp.]
MDQDLRARLAAVHARIDAAAVAAGRSPADVALLLATKTQPADVVRAAVLAHRALGTDRRLLCGENRVQELVAKAPELADLAVPYHLIGPLQSNKVNAALRWADAIDAVDSLALAARLADRRAARPADLDVMVQVNVSGEAAKHGAAPAAAVALALGVAGLAGLRLVGFQTVGALSADPSVVRAGFAALRAVRDEVVASGAPRTAGAAELSMGMTGDLELAIAEGATMVRVGTAVFGARTV